MIKVGLVGYGTIGKRVADAIALQKDMKLVGVTGHTYNYKMEVANKKGFKIFSMDGTRDFTANGIKPAGNVNDLLSDSDVIVDCTPREDWCW